MRPHYSSKQARKRGGNLTPSGWLALSNIGLGSQQSNLKGLGGSIGLSAEAVNF